VQPQWTEHELARHRPGVEPEQQPQRHQRQGQGNEQDHAAVARRAHPGQQAERERRAQ